MKYIEKKREVRALHFVAALPMISWLLNLGIDLRKWAIYDGSLRRPDGFVTKKGFYVIFYNGILSVEDPVFFNAKYRHLKEDIFILDKTHIVEAFRFLPEGEADLFNWLVSLDCSLKSLTFYRDRIYISDLAQTIEYGDYLIQGGRFSGMRNGDFSSRYEEFRS